MLPPELRGEGVTDAVYPMARCLYGHPASGHLFTNHVFDFLVARGWRPVGRAGSRALMARGHTLICVYVDDVKAAGPAAELSAPWAEMRAVDPPRGARTSASRTP